MIIRPETDVDLAAIDRIQEEAFRSHPYSRQTEHLIVRALRESGGLSLSLVAESEGAVLGHLAFSPAWIDGALLGWYTLGPVAVLPARQGEGIGSTLIRAGLDRLRGLGAAGCLLVGSPGYYMRFGFRPSEALHVDEVPPEFFMVLPFGESRPSGRVTHHPAFHAGL